uniref:MFS domain-containing protein n=1 Tax=Heterorhabditis bacteriophora TaxID=37862 RepID=A0A1I7X4L2_HETBA
MSRRIPSLRMVFVALVVSLGGSFHFGYQLALTNPAQEAFIQFLNETIGRQFVHHGSHELKASTLSIPSIWLYIISRVCMGLSVSLSLGLAALFLSEARYFCNINFNFSLSGERDGQSKVATSFSSNQVSVLLVAWIVALSCWKVKPTPGKARNPKECRGSIGMITGTCVQFGTVVGSVIAMPQIFGTFDLWSVLARSTENEPCLTLSYRRDI